MKRPIIYLVSAVIAVTSACALAGCGSDSSKAESKVESAQSSAAQSSAAQSSAQSGGTISADDAVFSFNGVKVELNGDANAAISALGEYKDVSSQLSCHSNEGEDKTYTYENFVLNTYPLNGQDRVLEVVIKSADIPTSKGVKVGDTASAVKAAYGDGFREVGTYYAYDAGDGKSLQFLIENDTVKEIDYYYDV